MYVNGNHLVIICNDILEANDCISLYNFLSFKPKVLISVFLLHVVDCYR